MYVSSSLSCERRQNPRQVYVSHLSEKNLDVSTPAASRAAGFFSLNLHPRLMHCTVIRIPKSKLTLVVEEKLQSTLGIITSRNHGSSNLFATKGFARAIFDILTTGQQSSWSKIRFYSTEPRNHLPDNQTLVHRFCIRGIGPWLKRLFILKLLLFQYSRRVIKLLSRVIPVIYELSCEKRGKNSIRTNYKLRSPDLDMEWTPKRASSIMQGLRRHWIDFCEHTLLGVKGILPSWQMYDETKSIWCGEDSENWNYSWPPKNSKIIASGYTCRKTTVLQFPHKTLGNPLHFLYQVFLYN